MAAPPIAVERFRVEHGTGFTMSVISLIDRRAAGNRVVRFVFQRHLEAVLYGRIEGSSGPIWKLMNQTGMSSTTLSVSKQSVTANTITDSEYNAIMAEFRSSLPGDMVDPSSLGRIRNCTILPIAPLAVLEPRWPGSVLSISPFHRLGSFERSRRRMKRQTRWTSF